jgi:hypothetical protein
MANQVKSLISSYQDNRFNGLFQCAAELAHHLPLLKDLLTSMANTKTRDNGKVLSEFADLTDGCVDAIIQALALIFIQVTSPYWEFVNSNVAYLPLYKFLQPLHASLADAKEQPEIYRNKDFSFIPEFPANSKSPLSYNIQHTSSRV